VKFIIATYELSWNEFPGCVSPIGETIKAISIPGGIQSTGYTEQGAKEKVIVKLARLIPQHKSYEDMWRSTVNFALLGLLAEQPKTITFHIIEV
jgi:hypothetical protein